MGSKKQEAAGIAVAVATFVVVLLVALSVLTVGNDIPPTGAECVVDTATTSGAVGVEEVRWSPLPTRRCVVGGEALGGAGSGLGTLAIAFVVAVLAAGATASVLERSLRRRAAARAAA